MKRLLLTGAFLATVLSATAGSFYEQLCAFNFNWKKYSVIAPSDPARSFTTDADYVAAHLGAVLPILRNNSVEDLSAQQLATRTELISLLDGYRMAGQFPLNHYRTERIPVFIDEHGTHCAVGYLMMRSGYESLAQRISRTDNYVWVKDITDPEALAWQEYSGFTMEELKLIQGAYDWYDPMAWYVPNKYETPQMPICTTAYFEAQHNGDINLRKEERVWCKGEGNGKTVNGKWEQNYAPGVPWIKGFFVNGQRSGDWEEYYPGTKILCRTESWRHNKLNGVRKRFDRQSRLVEEITFIEGNAVCKINYSLYDSLAYVRIPQDSATVLTKVYNNQGKMIACGYERIYNPSGLLWFQNIELTALNSIQVSTRATQQSTGTANTSNFGNDGGYNTGSGGPNVTPGIRTLLGGGGGYEPSLVEYHKTGKWIYYPERSEAYASKQTGKEWFLQYQHFGHSLYNGTAMFNSLHRYAKYDSLKVIYEDNAIVEFYGLCTTEYTHYKFQYYTRDEYFANDEYYQRLYHPAPPDTAVNGALAFHPYLFFPYNYSSYRYEHYTAVKKSAGQYNRNGERIGEWFYYTTAGQTERKEEYLIPFREVNPAETKEATVAK